MAVCCAAGRWRLARAAVPTTSISLSAGGVVSLCWASLVRPRNPGVVTSCFGCGVGCYRGPRGVVGLGQGGRPQEASAAKGKEPSAGTSFIIRPSRCLEMVCETYLLQLRLVLREIRAHLGEGLRRLIVGHGAR